MVGPNGTVVANLAALWVCHAGAVSSTVSAAVRAAVLVATRLDVACAEPAVLADGANVIVHLSPSPLVAKVAASTAVIRPDVAAWLQRELDMALFLARADIPVMAPASGFPATVHHSQGHVMSLWDYIPPSGTQRPDEDTIGSMLRELHAALRTCRVPRPVLAPLGDIPAFLARPQTLLSPSDVARLADVFGRLAEDLAAASAPAQALHGDAGVGNLMAAGGQWVWHDFEDTCSGPVAWDLAATTASPRLNRSRILAAYGDPVDEALLHTCEQLRRLHLTIWYALYAERLPGCRQRAAELLATWRELSS
jgi:Ser/Thr protein kinase RdoA (MazF antagonist)